MITSIDGTEWAQVTLEPRNWWVTLHVVNHRISILMSYVCRAQICRAKAIDWKTRNPANPAHLQLRLESLKRMKNAYQVYEDVSESPKLLNIICPPRLTANCSN